MTEFISGGEHEVLQDPRLVVEAAFATRGLYLAQEQALQIHLEVTAQLRHAEHKVDPPEGYFFSIISRQPGLEVRVGKWYPPGVHPQWGNGSPLLYEQVIETTPDDAPFLAEQIVVVHKLVLGIHPDGSAREIVDGDSFGYTLRTDAPNEALPDTEG